MDNDGWIPIDRFNSIRVCKYNGEYQIQRGYRNDNNTYDKWAIDSEWKNSVRVPKRKKNSDEWQPFPVLLPLTRNKDQALKIWESIGNQLKRL